MPFLFWPPSLHPNTSVYIYNAPPVWCVGGPAVLSPAVYEVLVVFLDWARGGLLAHGGGCETLFEQIDQDLGAQRVRVTLV